MTKLLPFIFFFLAACNLDTEDPAPPIDDSCSQACEGKCENGTCVCENGYTGNDCDLCDEGFQDNDQNGTCEPTCDTKLCNNGTCSDVSGQAECICADGFLGPDCVNCENGKQDNDENATCLPNCESADLICGEAKCDDSEGVAQCVCPLGFLLQDGNLCSLAVPVDPGFSGTGWTPYGLAGLTPGVEGHVDAGVGTFGEEAFCAQDSGFSQNYGLASPEVIGNYKGVLAYSVTSRCRRRSGFPFGLCTPGPSGPAIRLNGNSFDYTDIQSSLIQPIQNFPPDHQVEICLGEAYFGESVDLQITHHSATTPSVCSLDFQGLESVDHLSFRSSADDVDCPLIGQVLNSTFSTEDPESAEGWLVHESETGTVLFDDPNSEVALSASERCDTASIRGKINVPLLGSAKALSFKHVGSEHTHMTLQGQTVRLPSRDSKSEFLHCIPSWMNGTVGALSFGVSFVDTAGACSDLSPRDLAVSGVGIVDEANCEATDGFVNGDFEQNGFGWAEDRRNESTEISYVSVEGDTFVSVAGAGCSGAIRQSVFVPNDGSVNAIEYTYRLNDASQTEAEIVMTGMHSISQFYVARDLETSVTPSTHSTCLDANLRGRPWNLTILSRLRKETSCSERDDGRSPERLEVGEIKMINDPSCP